MKSLLCLFLAQILAATGFAQSRQLTGFIDIPFGTDETSARKKVEERTGARIDNKSSHGKLWFNGGTFAGYPANYLVLEFTDQKLTKGVAFIKRGSGKPRDEYKTFKKLLTEKYGSGARETTDADHPRVEWRFATPGNAVPDSLVLEIENDSHACKITYSTSRFVSSPTPSSKSQL